MPRFEPGAHRRSGAGQVSSATPEFLQQVEELRQKRDVKGLSNLIDRTNRPEKIEPAAEALGEIGTNESKDELLSHLISLNPKSDLIWPFVLPLIGLEDVPQLLDFEKQVTTRNARIAAKYKLPVEGQELLITYVKEYVSDAPVATLLALVRSRYSDVSNTTFEYLLTNDSPDIRDALRAVMCITGDMRKADKRALLSFDELLTRTPAEKQKKLLTEAFNSYSVPVSKRAGKMLAERHQRYFLRIIRQKISLSATDVQVLLDDGSENSIARIIEEEKNMPPSDTSHFVPSEASKEKRSAMAHALNVIGTPEARKALKSLERKYRHRPAFPRKRANLMDRGKKAEVLRRIKAIVKYYGSVRPGRWIYTDRLNIKPRDALDTHQLYVCGNYDNPNHEKAREVIKQAEEASGKLDEIRQDTFLELKELDEDLLDSYWGAVEQIESDINTVLGVLGLEKFESSEESIPHILRAIDRFDFRTLPTVRNSCSTKHDLICIELNEALSAAGKIEAPEIETSILELAERASKSDSLDDYQWEVASLCVALAEKGMKRALPILRKMSKSENWTLSVYSCRAILDLQGVHPDDKKNPYAIRARGMVTRAKERAEISYSAALLEDDDRYGSRDWLWDIYDEDSSYALRLSNALYCPSDIRRNNGIAVTCDMCGRSVDFGDLGGRRERTQFAKRGMCKRCLDMSRDGEVELDYSTFMAFVQSHPGACQRF